MLKDVLPCKTTLTVNAMAVKAANTCLSLGAHGVLVHAHIKTPLTTTGTQAFSLKLHLTTFKVLTIILFSYIDAWLNYS